MMTPPGIRGIVFERNGEISEEESGFIYLAAV
jgi:hypothetical protein